MIWRGHGRRRASGVACDNDGARMQASASVLELGELAGEEETCKGVRATRG